MKILMVVPYYKPAWGFGGAPRACYDIATGLARKKHGVTVATTDALSYKDRCKKLLEYDEGVQIIRFKNISTRLAKRLNLYTPIGFGKWIKYNINQFDLVHNTAFFTYQNIVGSRYCKRYNIPYVVHIQESPVPVSGRGKLLIKKIFNLCFGKSILLNAARIIVLSDEEKEELINYLPKLSKKIIVVPNGIKILEVPEGNGDRARYKLKKTDKIIVTLCRLHRMKGIDLLINAVSELVKSDNNFKLLVAGADEGQLSTLQRQVKKLRLENNVFFLGLVTGKDKENLLQISDVFALFSRYEPFGIVVPEAMNYSLPLCLSKYVNAGKKIVSSGCGKIVSDLYNPSECAKDIRWVYQNRAKLGQQCFRALKQFEIGLVIDKINLILRTVTKTTLRKGF